MKSIKSMSREELLREVRQLHKQVDEMAATGEQLERQVTFLLQNPVPVLQSRYDGTITAANASAENVFGGKLNGKSLLFLFPSLNKTNIKRLTGKKPFQLEEKIGERWFLFTFWKDTAAKSLYVCAGDFSEFKRKEEVLKQSKEKLRALYNCIPMPTYTWQNDGEDFVLVDYNDAAVEFTNGNVVDYLGMKARKMSPDMPEITEELSECFNRKDSIERRMTYKMRSTGESKEFAVKCTFVPPDLVMVHVEDITERKKTEKELRESEQKYRDLYDNAPFMCHSLDPQGTIIDCNKTELQTLGYTREEFVGHKIFEFQTQESARRGREAMRTLRRGGEITALKLQFRCKDGRVIDVLLNASTVTDDKGRMLYSRSVMRDVTERKARLDVISKLSSAITLSTDSVLITDRDGVIEYVNPAFEKTTGYTKNDAIGKKPNILKSGMQEDKFYERLWKTVLSGKPFKGITINKKKSGEIYSSELTITPILDDEGSVTNFVAVSRDITEKKQADDEISLLLGLTYAVNDAPDTNSALEVVLQIVCKDTKWSYGEAWILTIDGKALECSSVWHGDIDGLSEFRRLTEEYRFLPSVGLPGSVWSSKKPMWIPDVSTDSEDIFLRATEARAAGLKAALGIPIIADREVLAVLVFFMNEASEINKRFVNLVSSVGVQLGSVIRRKMAEEKIVREHGILVQTNEELRKAFKLEEQLRDKLVMAEKLASLGEMAAKIAHEINNPLTVVKAQAEIKAQAVTDPELKDAFTVIGHKADQIRDLTRGYMNLAKPTDIEMKSIKLGDVLKATINSLKPLGQLKHIELIESYPEDEPLILGDSGRLEQVFRNLVLNAVDATADVAHKKITAGIKLAENGKAVEAFISDNGVEIEPENLDKIFEHYYSTKELGSGTGLGLVIVKEITEQMHGGRVTVESAPGKGTTFHIIIPVVEHSKMKKKILIADDEAYITDLFGQFFTKKGLIVRTANNGNDALDIYSNFAPDIVLSDIVMPGIDGLTLLNKIRDINPEQRIVMMTAYASKGEAKKVLVEMGIPLILKPPDLENELWKIINEELEKIE